MTLSLHGEIHVYRLNLSDTRELSQAMAWLSPDERERAGRYRHEPSKNAFICVRAALRSLLGHYLGRSAQSIRFELGEKGKPRLAGSKPDCGLVFNVSHSGDIGLVALALDTGLGIDVERIRTMAYRDGIAERCFAPAELAWWKALPPADQDAAFFRFWSCKEAFVKATGEGITLGLEACVMELSAIPRLVSAPSCCGPAEDWHLAEISLDGEYGAAVCHSGEPRILRLADATAVGINLGNNT